jgi:hypothetical protein
LRIGDDTEGPTTKNKRLKVDKRCKEGVYNYLDNSQRLKFS